MVILFVVFLFQFGVSCSCLAMNQDQQVGLLMLAECQEQDLHQSKLQYLHISNARNNSSL